MSNSNTSHSAGKPAPAGSKAAAVALGGTVALAGAAFLASQYFSEETLTGAAHEEIPTPAETPAPATTGNPEPAETVAAVSAPDPAGSEHIAVSPNPHAGNSGPSFDEAFAEARHEHGGGGGHFTWHGGVYNTYTVAEWDHLSAEEQSDFVADVLHHRPHDSSPDLGTDVDITPQVAGPGRDEITPSVEAVHPDIQPAEQSDSTFVAEAPVESVSEQHDIAVVERGSAHIGGEDFDYIITTVDDHDVVLVDKDQDGNFEQGFVDVDGDHVLDTHVTLDADSHQITSATRMDAPEETPLQVDPVQDESDHILVVDAHGQQHDVEIVDSGSFQTEHGSVDYVMTNVDGHAVAYYDTNHDGIPDEAIADVDGDNILDTHGSFDSNTHELSSVETLGESQPVSDDSYTDSGYDDMGQDFNNDGDTSDWVA